MSEQKTRPDDDRHGVSAKDKPERQSMIDDEGLHVACRWRFAMHGHVGPLETRRI